MTTLGTAHLVGVAVDPDTRVPIRVIVTVDGHGAAAVMADVYSAQFGRHHPHYGPRHAFDTRIGVPDGIHRICAVAGNVGRGRSTTLGCVTVTGVNDPVGELISAAHSSAGVAVLGWALDPDSVRPIRVALTLDGAAPIMVPASHPARVPAVWSGYGVHHGYSVTLAASVAGHTLCASAINIGSGHGTSLGCLAVLPSRTTAPSAPRQLTATETATSITAHWGAPAQDGGLAITGYQLVLSSGAAQTLPAEATSGTFTALTPATGYTISVTAANSVGVGAVATQPVITSSASVDIPPQTTPAPVSTSHYLRNLTGDNSHDGALMRAMGATDAGYNPSGHRYLVLHDIGAQNGDGVLLSATTHWLSYSALVGALDAYLDGYASSQNANAPLLVVVGTNNDGAVSRASGAAWASAVIEPIRSYAARYPNIAIAGADDIEPGFAADVASSRAWLTGYLAGTSAQFAFNGSADGCPTSSGTRCNNGWTTTDLHWLAGGVAPSRIISLPQIYNTAMPLQWHAISANGSQRINFAGPLTEWTACAQSHSCNSATNVLAWTMLFEALAADSRTAQSAMPYGTDLRIN